MEFIPFLVPHGWNTEAWRSEFKLRKSDWNAEVHDIESARESILARISDATVADKTVSFVTLLVDIDLETHIWNSFELEFPTVKLTRVRQVWGNPATIELGPTEVRDEVWGRSGGSLTTRSCAIRPPADGGIPSAVL